MKNNEFYQLLDRELKGVIEKKIDIETLSKLKQEQQQKSYALLIWFLDFYANIANVEQYITEGSDDLSCDIILDLSDSQGIKTFYLIQSKWNNDDNCTKRLESKQLKTFLSDIQLVIRGEKSETKNERFNTRYLQLQQHVKQNGRVKAIFLSLKNSSTSADENIASTKNSIGCNFDIEIFDISRIKNDFITKRYKKSIPPNPLSSVYSPEYEKIKISVVRDDVSSRNQIYIAPILE